MTRRDDKQVEVTSVTLNHKKVSVPPESGLSLKATAGPANATGVKWSVEAGSVAASGVTIDATTGVITLQDTQKGGGTVKIKATSDNGAQSWADLAIVETPTAIASTSASPKAGVYSGNFIHAFTSAQGGTGLKGSSVNEAFDSTSATPPWGVRRARGQRGRLGRVGA